MEAHQYDTCVIGAGPAGLAVARALAERNLPYTHYERHTGPGGIWDIDNPGGPMYETAHFISSKTLSGFGGWPSGKRHSRLERPLPSCLRNPGPSRTPAAVGRTAFAYPAHGRGRAS